MHRNWMSLKSMFNSNDKEAILEEASYYEYCEILKEDNFAPSTRKMLEMQKQTIQSAINSLKYQEKLVS